MTAILPKSLTPVLILKILHEQSSYDTPMTQEKIAEKLEQYGIVLERKAIGRYISSLVEADYPIEHTAKGYYIESLFIEDAKLQIVVDSVLSNRSLSSTHCKELVDELSAFGSPAFRSRIHNYLAMSTWNKPEKDTVRYNIAAIDEAIENGKQIRFMHNGTEAVTTSPVKVFVYHDNYYMVGVIDHAPKPIFTLYNFRIEDMTNVRIDSKAALAPTVVAGFEKGFDLQDYLAAHPIMLSRHRRAKSVKFAFADHMLEDIRSAFGENVSIQPSHTTSDELSLTAGMSTAVVTIDTEEAILFALRYPTSVFILSPDNVREQVKRRLQNGLRAYSEWEATLGK